MLNTIQKVLVIGISEKDSNKVCGYTENMKLVNVACDSGYVGKIVPVKITGVKTWSLDGEVYDK